LTLGSHQTYIDKGGPRMKGPPEARDLRDVVRIIENASRAHPAWSMAHAIVFNATDHLQALARTIEMRRFEETLGLERSLDALKIALPQLVVDAVAALKPELPKLVPNLSDDEWEKLKRDEDQRRERERHDPRPS
jgi:hypothetical protein